MTKRRKHKSESSSDNPIGQRRPIPPQTVGLGLALVLVMLVGGWAFADWWICLPASTESTFVGRQSCIQCHAQEAHLWTGSHHDLAMDRATDETVLGSFDNVQLEHHGLTSRMFRQDGKFMVRTEGPTGDMNDFEVKYVFGVEPLQQYMVEFDRADDMPPDEIARLQVLRISWDTQKEEWFYLSPPDVDESIERLAPDDDLHWTGIAQRWNNMCADCHSTNLQKNFDVRTKTYHTTFSEIDVSCEACHGPGSVHVQLAHSKTIFWDRKLGYGLAKLKGDDPLPQIQTCAKCHSRRRIVHPDFQPGEDFYDYFGNELLLASTYHADGQILDEVYVHGSFLQSKMYHKGIRCTDCHDPHTARLKHDGNQVCTSCHTHPASKYDSPTHHHHKAVSTGASCVECHMPETTYMDVDPRRDHSLRVPRPDLSVRLGTPNACTRCHLDGSRISSDKRDKLKQYADWILLARDGDNEIKDELARLDRWAHDQVTAWYGDKYKNEDHFAYALAKARSGDAQAGFKLTRLAKQKELPAIVRATVLTELAGTDSRESLAVAMSSLMDPDPQVRTAALNRIETEISLLRGQFNSWSAREGTRRFEPLVTELLMLLADPRRVVRTEAARVLAGVPTSVLGQLTDGPQLSMWREALDDFKTGVLVNNDRAAAHMTLAILHENLGDTDAAIDAYRTAIRVEPGVTGPRTNLASIYDRLAEQADQQVRSAIARRDRDLVDKLTNEYVKNQQQAFELRRGELALLARDARLAPENAAIQYRYGLSLYLHNKQEEAEEHLLKACELEPSVPDYVLALALLYQKQTRWVDAIEFAGKLLDLRPQDPTYRQLMKDLQVQVKTTVPE